MRSMGKLKTGLLLLALLLTLISWLEVCSSACAEMHQWKIFGYSFELAGLAFFLALLALHSVSKRSRLFETLYSFSLFAAVGAEINFILIQSEVIGQWCPVCLTIASLIFLLAAIQLIEFISKRHQLRGFFMKSFLYTIALLCGFFIAFVGASKPERSFAEGVSHIGDPAFGKSDSPIEVYVVSDWFCPACEAAEPTIEALTPLFKREAKLYFIDLPIHPESMNFTPYNLSFMIHEKEKYLSLRKALSRLAKRTKEPTKEEVQEIAQGLGVTYKPLNYTNVNSGVRFFDGIVKAFGVNKTPTVVIANRKTLEAKKLSGREINRKNVIQALQEVKG